MYRDVADCGRASSDKSAAHIHTNLGHFWNADGQWRLSALESANAQGILNTTSSPIIISVHETGEDLFSYLTVFAALKSKPSISSRSLLHFSSEGDYLDANPTP